VNTSDGSEHDPLAAQAVTEPAGRRGEHGQVDQEGDRDAAGRADGSVRCRAVVNGARGDRRRLAATACFAHGTTGFRIIGHTGGPPSRR
jgi:hypothetical protein